MRKHWFAALAFVAVLVTGCGGGSGTNASDTASATDAQEAAAPKEKSQGPKLDHREGKRVATMYVAMDGFDSAETVSFLVAENLGYFRKQNLAPLTLSPVSPKLTIPDVVKGQDVVGVATTPEAVAAKDEGAPIVIVGSVLQQATAALIWPEDSGIETIADLKGKTIATPGLSSQASLLEQILTEEGVEPTDVKVIAVGNDLVPSLVKGRADAIFGGSGNVEGTDLESRGIQPVVTPVTALGVPDYDELVLVAREDVADANPDLIGDFVSALARGASTATAKPREATRFLEASGEKNPEIKPSAVHEQVAATVGMLSSSGHVDSGRLQQLIDWMFENKMIQQDLPVESLLPSS
jgi:putative hydroxymethylpyrimidine transport system substrate-binding protein